MHMADALVSAAVAGTMYVASGTAAAYSMKKMEYEEERIIPTMGVMGAFVFASQMINFTIPGTGSSGHLCGGMLLSAVVGPYAGFLTMIGVLLIQCLMFADGGLLALGANIWNMAFYGCFIGGGLIWRMMMRRGLSKRKIVAASVLGCVLTLQMGAFSVTLETLASGITELPFTAFLALMQPIHLAIGLVEGLITSAVLVFVYEARPEILWTGQKERTRRALVRTEGVAAPAAWPGSRSQDAGLAETSAGRGRLSFRKTLAILAAAAAVIAGVVSHFASAFPDGLEWSIERLTGSTEVEGIGGTLSRVAQRVQEVTAILPDYGFSSSDAALGTSVSGLVGAAAVILLCVLLGKLFMARREKR
ncbi:MAG: energy-coupling factor ABC transporter permease [Clostridiales bacterium]|nr:energy-coupling factor ABC transporter permease [Clostridiales bacterium]